MTPCIHCRPQSFLTLLWSVELHDPSMCPKTLTVLKGRDQCEALKNKKIDGNALAEMVAQRGLKVTLCKSQDTTKESAINLLVVR